MFFDSMYGIQWNFLYGWIQCGILAIKLIEIEKFGARFVSIKVVDKAKFGETYFSIDYSKLRNWKEIFSFEI